MDSAVLSPASSQRRRFCREHFPPQDVPACSHQVSREEMTAGGMRAMAWIKRAACVLAAVQGPLVPLAGSVWGLLSGGEGADHSCRASGRHTRSWKRLAVTSSCDTPPACTGSGRRSPTTMGSVCERMPVAPKAWRGQPWTGTWHARGEQERLAESKE